MSAKLSNKVRHHINKVTNRVGKQKQEISAFNWRMVLVVVAWVIVAFYASNLIVTGVLYFLGWIHLSPVDYLRPAVLQSLVAASIYGLMIGIVIGVPYYLYKHKTSLATLGLTRLPTWTDIGLAPVGFIVYTLALATIFALIKLWLPDLPLDSTQDIGFSTIGTQLDNLLAFLTLVVMAPIAEETVFRGYLYGKLKRYVPVVAAAIVTSLLFALAHGGLNVQIDVFVLSLLLCTMRSLTGSIWAGVLVHMLKNAIAYYILFVPHLGG